MIKLLKVIFILFSILMLIFSPSSIYAAPPSITELLQNANKENLNSSNEKKTGEQENQSERDSRSEKIKKLLALLDKWYEERESQSFKPTPTLASANNQLFLSNPNFFGKPKPIVVLLKEAETKPTPSSIPIAVLLAKVSDIILGSTAPTPTPFKTGYKIALLGDSMVDTLGPELWHLKTLLTKEYPNYSFTLYNYGQGGTNLDSGLFRLIHETDYLGQKYPPLLNYRPDILVVESFAYNHWSGEKYDLDRHWLTLAKIIDTLKIVSPETKIILAATIAPNAHTYGDGVLNWPVELKRQAAQITKAYLQNLTNFAVSQGFPLADAYHPSMDGFGQGLPKYINQGDHLHPSGEGGLLFSQKIVESIKLHDLIK